MVVSPKARPSATPRNKRLIIFPLRVFGKSAQINILSGFAIGPILLRRGLAILLSKLSVRPGREIVGRPHPVDGYLHLRVGADRELAACDVVQILRLGAEQGPCPNTIIPDRRGF